MNKLQNYIYKLYTKQNYITNYKLYNKPKKKKKNNFDSVKLPIFNIKGEKVCLSSLDEPHT